MIGMVAGEKLKSGEYKGKAQSAAEYIRESIVDPEAFIAHECPTGPCPHGVMPATLAQTLSAEELDAVVEYLAGLK
jgi:nitric oxide reductase subunit C